MIDPTQNRLREDLQLEVALESLVVRIRACKRMTQRDKRGAH
ncbi:MAG: hypothetical protein V3V97_10480 [Hyphomicrobiaceae bacterium]